MTTDEIAALKARIGDRKIIASVSGGKDSAAMCLYLRELELPYEAIAMDTGWEEKGWREYVEGPLTRALGPIKILRAEVKRVDLIDVSKLRPRVRAAVEEGSAMVQLILRKAMFPSKARRFCTEELKAKPAAKYINALVDEGAECINAVGIRSGESAARAKMTEWDWSEGFDCEVWRPIIHWTERDVIDIHQRHGLTPNPLYLRGASRVGCWPCIYARKSEIRHIAEVDPERIELLRELEADVAGPALARHQAKVDAWRAFVDAWRALPIDERINRRAGMTTLADLDAMLPRGRQRVRGTSPIDADRKMLPRNTPGSEGSVVRADRSVPRVGNAPRPLKSLPAWFQATLGGVGDCWPIDRVVEWSRTVRGGREEDKQVELFAGMNDGCMRWGLCETATEE